MLVNTTSETGTANARAKISATIQPTNETTSPIRPRIAEMLKQTRTVSSAAISNVVNIMVI